MTAPDDDVFGEDAFNADCRTCDGAGVVQTGTSKWTGAKFSTCPACQGSGTR